LVEKFPDRFELSDTPVAGAIFSKGIGAEYGHTGMVVSVSDDGNEITIVHGNMNGISDPWEIAITDWRLETVNISYFEYHYGEAYPYVFANPLDGAVQE
ncbi:MAG: CHAP domain-containing protein, partial [Bacillota bacterium]|nr:CHAP domain-containing protein [Bacillota bacterium]